MRARSILIIIAILALLGVAYYISTRGETAAVTEDETPVQTQIDAEAVETAGMLVGVWKSLDDTKFTREFTTDGKMVDRYEGIESAATSGDFKVYTTAMNVPTNLTFTPEADTSYIQATVDGEIYNFRVTKVGASSLELIYMDRGGVLRFSKVQ